MRPVTLDDLAKCVALFNAESQWLNGHNDVTDDLIRIDWESPIFNLPTDTMAIFLGGGEPVAYAEFWDQREPHVTYFGFTSVHPDYQQDMLDEQLMDWLIGRARQNVSKAPEGARVTLQRSVESQYQRAKETLSRCGFTQIRAYYRMQIDFTTPPPQPELPEGIVIRSIHGAEEQRAALYTAYASFKDHWGHTEEPFEDYYQRRMYFVNNDPNYDPSLWFIALDREDIAGVSLCMPHLSEDEQMGWVGTLGVRQNWRKRGLGLGLLLHSFGELYRRGKPRVGLGVDAFSLTGATRLYERAGMRVTRQYDLYELELRAGKDLTKQELAETAPA